MEASTSVFQGTFLRFANLVLKPLRLRIVTRARWRSRAGHAITQDAFFEAACLSLLIGLDHLRIVQVGANDGKQGDPLWRVANLHPKRIQLLLCEPQPEIADELRRNYGNHPNVRVFEGAIGRPDSNLSLYRVKPEFWSMTNRNPTGFASFDKATITKNVQGLRNRIDGSQLDVERVIESKPVEVISLGLLLDRYPHLNPIDVLITDVEGLDAQIIRDSLNSQLLPKLILFESKHVSEQEKTELTDFLSQLGYQLFELGGNSLAVCAPKG